LVDRDSPNATFRAHHDNILDAAGGATDPLDEAACLRSIPQTMNRQPMGARPKTNGALAAGIIFVFGIVPAFTAMAVFERYYWGTWRAALAPFAAGLVAAASWVGLVFLERRMRGDRRGWPPALLGLPLAGVLAGLASAAVDPIQDWRRDAIIGGAVGAVAALWGWWKFHSQTPTS
jgi:hypothetical protein